MARIRFYYNTADPLALVCELVGKAVRPDRQVAIKCGSETEARQLDQLLWTHKPQSFIPHVGLSSPLAAETPVQLCATLEPVRWPHRDLLFNLTQVVAPEADEFKMIFEIVGRHDAEVQSARQRWQHYKRSGHHVEAIDSVTREAL